MKTIIAGSRTIIDYNKVLTAIIKSDINITEVVSGSAKGVDELGEKYAKSKNIPLKIFKADWNKFGKSAGMIRNAEMANYANALIAIWDGKSVGTKNMIELAHKRNLKVFVVLIKEN